MGEVNDPREDVKIGFIYDISIPELFGGLNVQILRTTYASANLSEEELMDVGTDLFKSLFQNEIELFEGDLKFEIADIMLL